MSGHNILRVKKYFLNYFGFICIKRIPEKEKEEWHFSLRQSNL